MPMLINEPLAAIPGRTYTAWIPSNPPLATAPVILVFHGGGQETATIARAWGVVPPGPPPANVADYIIVFPQTHPELEDRWYTFSSRSVGFPEIDLNYTDALIDELTTRLYPTGAGAVNPQVTGDPAPVYASGFSSGGGMVWQMINSPLVARLAGAAAVGKPLDVEKASRYRRTIAPVAPAPIPMFYLQGTADDGFRGTFLADEPELDTTLPFATLREMLTRNGIAAGPAATTLVPGSTGVTEVVLQLYAGGAAAYQHGTVINGGHNWPTPTTVGNPPVANHFNSTEAVVDFWRLFAGLP